MAYWAGVAAELACLMTWRDWAFLAYVVVSAGFYFGVACCASKMHTED